MNRLDMATRCRAISALVEGNSLQATARITGVARMTMEKLLRDFGAACQAHHDKTVRNLQSKRVQCDEIWAFCYAKKRTVQDNPSILERNPNAGDVWTWTAIDADSKLVISWYVGGRDAEAAYTIIEDVKNRLANRVQLTTDGFHFYVRAAEKSFGMDVDYATLNKMFDGGHSGRDSGGRYSPARYAGSFRAIQMGDPDPNHVSTSFVERNNLTMRMHMRRFTRLSNAFSKKVEMHAAAVALHFAYYNWCKVHTSLRVTPAMEARVSDHVWSVEELIGLLV